MRSIKDKWCYNLGPAQEVSSSSAISFEFHRQNETNNRASHLRTGLGKPTPSKWDDAQEWLVGLLRGRDKSQYKATPRNSNANDRRLITPVPHKEQDYLRVRMKEQHEQIDLLL
ncbi:hypothetical protein DITRI_Ditri12bG0049000 [Diplodiscus trichospermus]